jgi:glycosyltransferase involved in cell wall biosynthesis
MKAPISWCMIVKNEPLLEQSILSIKPYIQELVIVDTGSTDNTTQQIAKKYADVFEVYTDCNDPITGQIDDFSKARQRSFDLANCDWTGWSDADDQIDGGEHLIKFTSTFDSTSTTEAVAFLFPYEYSYDSSGKCICRHYRERLVSNKKHFHWHGAVHEVLIINDGIKVQLISDDTLLYKHRRQYSTKPGDPGRNLRILKKYIEGPGKNDARQMYYIGLEYCNNGFVNEAIASLTKYVEISGWDDERIMACLKLVDIYQGLAQYQEGLKWAFKCIEINENWSEGYLAAGRMFYFLAQTPDHQQLRNWQRCVHFIRTGLAIPPTKTLLFVNPVEREFEIHKYFNVALNAAGDIKGALDSVNLGLQSQPDAMLLGNKTLYEKHFAIQQISSSLDTLKNNKSIDDKAAEIVLSIVNNKITIDHLLNQKAENITSISNNKYDIVFCIGQGIEEWTPETIKKTGIGGSELMAAELSKRLAKLGNRVRVYNSCGNMEGIYDGVEYYRTEKYPNTRCDILIVSRFAPMVDEKYNIEAKLRLLWVHDVFALGVDNISVLYKYDRILALSEWHKQTLMNCHSISGDCITVTRNGIDLNRFNKQVKRNRYKVVNSSSPDRYLAVLLDCWMDIKTQVPQATLDIFYGFKNWEFVAQRDPDQMALIERLKTQMEIMKPVGVNFRDRVNQEQLAEEFLSAGVWAYSTWFSESSCISAMEAQAAGLRIVTSPIAALNETVANRGVLVPGEWTSQGYKKLFVQAVVEALQKEDDSDRAALQQHAKSHFDLDTLAQEWEKIFNTLMKNTETVDDSPIVGYNTFLGK